MTPSEWQRITEEFKEEAGPKESERRCLPCGQPSGLSKMRVFKIFGSRSRYGVAFASGLGINRLEDIQKWVGADRKFDVVRFGKEYSQVHRESIIRNNSNRTAALVCE